MRIGFLFRARYLYTFGFDALLPLLIGDDGDCE